MKKLIAAAVACVTLSVGVFAPVTVVASNNMDGLIAASMNNEAGGEILLTREKGVCPERTLMVLASSAGGTVLLMGCWATVGTRVMVRWEDDVLSVFDARAFTPHRR